MMEVSRRRSLLAALGALLPRRGLGQPTRATIGLLSSRSKDESKVLLQAFREGLAEAGFTEGINLSVHYRWGHGHEEWLPGLAVSLMTRPIDLMVAADGERAAMAALGAANGAVPVIFMIRNNAHLLTSLCRHGDKAIGISLTASLPEAQRMTFLGELPLTTRTLVALVDPTSLQAAELEVQLGEMARHFAGGLRILRVRDDAGLRAALEALSRQPNAWLLVGPSRFYDGRCREIIDFANRQQVPALYPFRDYVAEGGLMSYGPSLREAHRLAAVGAADVLHGVQSLAIPIRQGVELELVINARTASRLGIELTASLLDRADEVIA